MNRQSSDNALKLLRKWGLIEIPLFLLRSNLSHHIRKRQIKTGLALGYSDLLTSNVKLNGYKALIYCFGLSAPKYIECTTAMKFLDLNPSENVLDIGCGHSVFPSILRRRSPKVSVMDINRNSLIWQIQKSRLARRPLQGLLSSGARLPFKDCSFSRVTALSAIEHFPGEGDIQFSEEMGRVLKPHGICVVSVPLVDGSKSVYIADWKWDMPHYLTSLLGPALPSILKKFNVDRSPVDTYFAKKYCMSDVFRRIVEPSGFVLEDSVRFNITMGTMIRTHIFPVGVLTPLDYWLVRFAEIGNEPTGGIILKLRKEK